MLYMYIWTSKVEKKTYMENFYLSGMWMARQNMHSSATAQSDVKHHVLSVTFLYEHTDFLIHLYKIPVKHQRSIITNGNMYRPI